MLDAPGVSASIADRTAKRESCASGLDYALRIGGPDVATWLLPAPGGPVVTWRSVCAEAMPPLANWQVGMGDVELF